MALSKMNKANKARKVFSRVKKQKASKPSTKKKPIHSVKKPDSNLDVFPLNSELSIVEKAQLIENAGSVNGNEFSEMRYEIAKKIVEYDRIRKECDIHDDAHSKTIYRLAKPFIDGHFTLAVVGKMSAGKSTFINTLIGDNVFPTGHFQTTSTLTFIENGDETKMEVFFCDGHREVVDNDIIEIKDRLKRIVAIPEEYNKLPINDINILISSGFDITRILEKKDGIEEKRGLAKVDVSEWKSYVKKHPKSKIVKEVHINYPLPVEYQGWRIIDTPGLGATGGIQIATKMLFDKTDDDGNKIVDAIVFLHSGTDNIEDEAARNFVSEIVKGLTEDAKKRLFFVITKASETSFRNHKEGTLKKARELYAKSFGITEERFTYIDSLLERFNNSLEDRKYFDEKDCPSNWELDEWDQMTNLYTPIKKQLKQDGIQLEDESIKKIMKDWSNFDNLKLLLNRFMRKEKSVSYDKIFALLEEDYMDLLRRLRNDLRILDGDTTIEMEQAKLLQRKNKLNEQLLTLQEKAAIDIGEKFFFVDKEIEDISKIRSIDIDESINMIITAYLNLTDKVDNVGKEIFEDLKNEFKAYWENDDLLGLLEKIDFDELEKESEQRKLHDLALETKKDNTKPRVDMGAPVRKRKTFRQFFQKLFTEGDFSIYEITYPDKKIVDDVDEEATLDDFSEKVKQKARNAKDEHVEDTEKKVKWFNEEAYKKMNAKLEEAGNKLNVLKKQMLCKKEEMFKLERKIDIIEKRVR